MDLQKLQYFISVAECSSFTQASKQLYISQPSLSRQIAELETELKVQLFVRTKRNVVLTSEGEDLLERARKIVQQTYDLARHAHNISLKGAGSLCIGYPGYWEFQYVQDIIHQFSKENPHLNYTFTRQYHGKLLQKLKFGECDVIFAIMAPWEITPPFRWMPIAKSKLHVVLSADHPLAERKVIPMASLEGEKIIIISRAENPIVNDIIISCCRDSGFTPDLYPHSPANMHDLVLLLTAGKGVTMACPWLKLMYPNWLRFIPVDLPLPELEFGVAYREDNRAPYLLSLLESVEDTFSDSGFFDVNA